MKFETVQEIFKTLKGGTFIGLDTETKVALKGGKKNPLQGRVTKRTVGSNTMCFTNQGGSSYEAMVKRRLEEEGKDPETFEVKPRKWGTRIEGTPFVEHNGKHYLEVIFMRGGESEYFVDGKPAEKDEIEGLPEPKPVSEESQGGLENQVVIRSYAIESIKSIRANGQVWEDEDE